MPAVRLARVKGPDPDDCDFFTGAIGKDGYGPISTARAAEFACGRAPLRIGPLADGAIGAGRARAARVRHAAVREGLRHGSPAPGCVRALGGQSRVTLGNAAGGGGGNPIRGCLSTSRLDAPLLSSRPVSIQRQPVWAVHRLLKSRVALAIDSKRSIGVRPE